MSYKCARITDNSIPATAFKQMKAPFTKGEREENETDKGLRIADRGFLNTAVIRSEITFIDGDAGGESIDLSVVLTNHISVLRYRYGHCIEQASILNSAQRLSHRTARPAV